MRRTLLTLTLVAMFGVVFFIFASPWLDSFGVSWVQCKVESAEAVENTSRFGGPPWSAAIQTSDCGQVSYREVHTEESARAFAEELQIGEVYEFQLGIVSKWAMHSPFEAFSPIAKEVRPTS